MREAVPPLPQYFFLAWCLVKYRDNFTFYLYPQPENVPCRGDMGYQRSESNNFSYVNFSSPSFSESLIRLIFNLLLLI
jgi:hypothetical protein